MSMCVSIFLTPLCDVVGWSQLGNDQSKCEVSPEPELQAFTQGECNAAAEAARAVYFSFRNDGYCFLSWECIVKAGTAALWRIFAKPTGMNLCHHHGYRKETDEVGAINDNNDVGRGKR